MRRCRLRRKGVQEALQRAARRAHGAVAVVARTLQRPEQVRRQHLRLGQLRDVIPELRRPMRVDRARGLSRAQVLQDEVGLALH